MIRGTLVGAVLALGLLFAPGASAKSFIEGGKTANEGQFPWMAWVEIGGYEEPEPSFEAAACSGTVVAPTVVLTAGHCTSVPNGVALPASEYKAVTGAVNRRSGVKTSVVRVMPYPGFKWITLTPSEMQGHDAGLLILSKPVSVRPIALAQNESLWHAGEEVFAAGWGLTTPNAIEIPEILRWVNTTLECVGSVACEDPTIATHDIEAGSPQQKGTCEGDSGGPLWRETAAGPVEIGLTSRGPSGACNQTVFTNVAYIRPWIEEQLGSGAPELGRCLKVAAGTGGYGNSTCTAADGTKTYGFEQAFGSEAPLAKPGFTTQIKAAALLTLETAAGTKLTCTGESGGGQFTTLKSTSIPKLILTGCANAAAEACTSSGASAGEIRSGELTGTYGILKAEALATKDKVGLALRPASGETIATFNCGATAFALRGAVIGETKANAMASTVTLKFAESKGTQKWVHFEGGGTLALEAKVGAGAYESAGMTLTSVQTNEEKVELSSLF